MRKLTNFLMLFTYQRTGLRRRLICNTNPAMLGFKINSIVSGLVDQGPPNAVNNSPQFGPLHAEVEKMIP